MEGGYACTCTCTKITLLYVYLDVYTCICVHFHLSAQFHLRVNVLLYMKTTFVVAKAENKNTDPTNYTCKTQNEWGTHVLSALRTRMVHVQG